MNSISDKTKNYLDMLGQKFSKNNFCEFIRDLLNLNEENIVNGREQRATTLLYEDYIESAQLYAKYNDENRKSIGVIIIKLKNDKHPANARTLQRNYISHLMDYYDNLDASLTAIYSDTDDSWRLSFVKQELTIEVGKLKTKVSPAKRYSYLFGKDEPNHTAKEQLLELLENNTKQYSVEEIENKFSVEKVTKDFFEKYKENYLALKENLENNEEFLSEASRCDFTAEEFTKKLMGQIVFIYFLQKKGWLGVRIVPSKLSSEDYSEIYNKESAIGKRILEQYYINFSGYKKIKTELLEHFKENESDLNTLSNIFANTKFDMPWGTGKRKFIRTLFENCKDRNKNFFDDYLEPFFYNGLNHQRDNQYFSVFNCKVPFLNGGLFEPLDNYNWETARFDINNDIFSNENETGILDFFDRYNFTMNEEEPLEKDVAVDPEMLGKIFENLLDVKDRKSKGAFYTPREIVHYMCQESLANFLVNKVGVEYNEIREFIQYGEMIRDIDLKEVTKNGYRVGESIFKNISKIDKALENIKIADPAVGSGAFPLGMLNEIVKLRDILTSYMLIYNKLGLFDRIYPEEVITNRRTIYKIKWNTIKNCIYAVDIENSAVDITKLRLWLSIVVDQVQVPKTGPEPLPNLNCKIMQGNSLVNEYKGIKLIDEKFVEELKDRENIKFNGSNGTLKDSKGHRQYISDNQIELGDGQKKVQIDDLIRLKQELYEENDASAKKILLEKIQTTRNELLKLNFAHTNNEEELMAIDKSHNKPYFAWMLEFIEVFIENNGFDIVIGNPPYVGELGNKDIFRPIAQTNFGRKFYMGKMDLFYFFFHKGIDILSENGELSFITTNYYLTSDGGKRLRQDFKDRTFIRKIINFNEVKVFDSARGQHNAITFLTKIRNKNIKSYMLQCNGRYNATSQQINNILNENDEELKIVELEQNNIYDGPNFYIRLNGVHSTNSDNNSIESILDKMVVNKKLSEMFCVNQGILTGCDSLTKKHINEFNLKNYKEKQGIFVFDLSNEEDINTINNFNNGKKLLRDMYKNSNIDKWTANEEPNKKILYYQGKLDIEKYNDVYNHLLKFKPILEKRLITYGENYDWTCIHRSREENIFTGEKIVVPYRSKKNIFGYNNSEWFCCSDVFIITNKTNVMNLKTLLSLLNSKLYYFWLYHRGKRKGDILELVQKPLLEIPIISMTEANEMKLIELADKIIAKKTINKDADINELENEVNDIIYKELKLTSEEIKLVEECYYE